MHLLLHRLRQSEQVHMTVLPLVILNALLDSHPTPPTSVFAIRGSCRSHPNRKLHYFRTIAASTIETRRPNESHLFFIAPTDQRKLSPPYTQSDRKRYRPFKVDLSRVKMSGYYYPPHTSPPDEDEFDFTPSYPIQGGQTQAPYQNYIGQPTSAVVPQQPFYGKRSSLSSRFDSQQRLFDLGFETS